MPERTRVILAAIVVPVWVTSVWRWSGWCVEAFADHPVNVVVVNLIAASVLAWIWRRHDEIFWRLWSLWLGQQRKSIERRARQLGFLEGWR